MKTLIHLTASGVVLALLGSVQVAVGQTPEVPNEHPRDTITVTGTRIQGIDLEGAQPLIVIDREEIDLFETLSVAGGGEGTFSTRTAGALSSSSPVGSAGVSLRGRIVVRQPPGQFCRYQHHSAGRG